MLTLTEENLDRAIRPIIVFREEEEKPIIGQDEVVNNDDLNQEDYSSEESCTSINSVIKRFEEDNIP